MEKPLTPYAQAWYDFRQTGEYLRAEAAMLKKGMNQPYIDNILRVALDAAWNSKPIP